jgi:hypothetical protein
MPKKKSNFNRLTWIFTELILGLAGLIFGLWATIVKLPEINAIYIVILSVGGMLLIVSILQLILLFKKREKIYCAKCGERIKRSDDFCSKCGEKIESK